MNADTPTATKPVQDTTQQRFGALLRSAQKEGRLQRLLLAKPHNAEPGLQRVVVRPLLLRGQPVLSFVYSYSTRDITKNLPVDEGLALVDQLLAGPFRNAHLFTPGEETQLTLSKKGKAHLGVHPRQPSGDENSRQAARAAQNAAQDESLQGDQPALPAEGHDRTKQRYIHIERPFLAALGVTTAQHQLVPAMARKWKQINRFVEIFDHALQTSPLATPQPNAPPLRVVDFGAGKAYLTFAVHDWLQQGRHRQTDVVGVELRPDLVQQGNRIVSDLGLQGLRLHAGDVRDWQQGTAQTMDVMIALHACDTATDHALHLGIRAGASILLCSPCCHKQLRPQLLSPHPLRSVFQHGIHAEQQAEMLTDSLRALLLEAHGYDTQVFEFVALEHTRKNKMILAVKRPQPPAAQARQEALNQVEELKRYFGVREHCLQTLLADESAMA